MDEKAEAKQEFSKLTVVLLFIIIFILLAGTLATVWFTSSQTKQYEKLVIDLRAEVASQKSEKNAIRSIWQDQVIQNEKLVTSQENVFSQLKNYNLEISNTFKFVDKKAQILPTASEDKLKKVTDQLNLEVKNLQDNIADSIKVKNKNKAEVDDIYIQSGEVQTNITK
jgi:flagellar basal body-associated protein FliL